MGEAGRKTVAERFTWEAIAGEMEQAYQQITSDRKRTQLACHSRVVSVLEDTRHWLILFRSRNRKVRVGAMLPGNSAARLDRRLPCAAR